MDRRGFIRRSVSSLGTCSVAGAFSSLLQLTEARGRLNTEGFGPLRPAKDETTGLELLQLPEGFRYVSFGWQGDPLSGGGRTPRLHDGMAAVGQEGDLITLIRNHEVRLPAKPFAVEAAVYDPVAGGGCTALVFDGAAGKMISSRASLSGTAVNCAGGATPWGSWLSCEEVVLGPRERFGKIPSPFRKKHGYVFEVPPAGLAEPIPLMDMGRFVHEAVAVDPETGNIFETEDRAEAGLYRFVPHEPRTLSAGGQLQMLKAIGADDTRSDIPIGKTFDVTWVEIEDPDLGHSPDSFDMQGVYGQGKNQGGTTFARLEGICYDAGNIFITATSGGSAQQGQVWQYSPRDETVMLLYESPGVDVLSMPDNMTVSPRGGIVLCEDGKHVPQRLQGLTPKGQLFEFARNNLQLAGHPNSLIGDFRGGEFAGATFSPDGKWLFFNTQTPGATFAVTGPWQEGLL